MGPFGGGGQQQDLSYRALLLLAQGGQHALFVPTSMTGGPTYMNSRPQPSMREDKWLNG